MNRNITSLIYGALDLLFATTYAFLFLKVVPSRETWFTVLALTLCFVHGAGGIGMMVRAKWGAKVALISSLVMLVACALLILGLVASAAYLHGIYDGIGEAGSAIAIIVALLAIEVVGLLPALQLAHLLNRRQQPQT